MSASQTKSYMCWSQNSAEKAPSLILYFLSSLTILLFQLVLHNSSPDDLGTDFIITTSNYVQ